MSDAPFHNSRRADAAISSFDPSYSVSFGGGTEVGNALYGHAGQESGKATPRSDVRNRRLSPPYPRSLRSYGVSASCAAFIKNGSAIAKASTPVMP